MLKRSVKKTTSEQFELLKFEMSKHPAAAIGYGVGTDRGKVDAEWKEIVVKLNDIGPPHRTVTEWKKVWSDVRLRIKKRLSEQYSGKNRKRRKRNDESESEEDFLMESLNNTNSIYATHSCPSNEHYDIPEIVHDSSPTSHEEFKVQRNNEDVFQPSVSVAGTNYVVEEENHRSVKKKTTKQQFELLKYEMSKHPAAAMGYGAGTVRNEVDADWREIIVKLNAIGPPHRTVAEWKKVWSDVRLRIKKRIGEQHRRKSRKINNESESEEDLLMEALNSSIYASLFCPDNEDCDEPEITHEPCPPIFNGNRQQSTNVDENNPLEETELPEVDSKHHLHAQFTDLQESNSVVENNPLEDDELTAVESKKHCHQNCEISDPGQSPRNSFMEHTLYTLQSQMEQHNKFLEQLSRISASVSGLMERQVAVMERRTQLMESQAKASQYHDFLRRRQETRKKLRGKTFEWF